MKRSGRWMLVVLLWLPAAALAQSTGDIEVNILQVGAIDSSIDFDIFFNNQAEFYAAVGIAGMPLQETPWIPGKDFIGPNWLLSETVPRDVRFQPVHIEILDHDQLDDFSDNIPDQCDINPVGGLTKLDLVFDTCTFTWTGSVSGGPESILVRGFGDNDRAEVTFDIDTGDSRPFSPDDVAIHKAAPVQVIYDPDYVVAGKPTVLRVDFTSSYSVPRDGTVVARMRDGLGNMTEETRMVTVPPEGTSVFFFDGSGTADPFVPLGTPNGDSFCWDVEADFGMEGPVSPPPALINCYGDNNQVLDHCKRMVFIDNPTTVYMSWDWDSSSSFASPGELIDTFASGEDFREATSPISQRNSFLAPFDWATPGPGTAEPIPTMIRASVPAMMAGIDRLVLVPRPGWFDDNAASSPFFDVGTIGISMGEFIPWVVISEAGFSQTTAHEIGHTYRLSRRNCTTGGIWEYLIDVGCRDEYKHFPGVPAPYPAVGFDVVGNIFPSGASPIVPGTRDVNSLNLMGATGAAVFTYDRWIDDLNYNWLLRDMAAVPPVPLEGTTAFTQVFNLTGFVQATNGIESAVPQFAGELFPAYRIDAATAPPDVDEAPAGGSSGVGPFAARLITPQGIREYRFSPPMVPPEGTGPVDFGFFSFAVPWDDTAVRLELYGPSDVYNQGQNQDVLLYAVDRTAAAPSVQNLRAGVDTPPTQAGPQPEPPTIPPGHGIGVSWTNTDPDSALLSSVLLLVPPAQVFDHPLPLSFDETDGEFVLPAVQADQLPPGDYGLRVQTSDGLNDSFFDVSYAFTICEFTNGGVEVCDGLDNDCNGLVDDMAAPAAATGVGVSGIQVFWDNLPAASGYDVIRGLLSGISQSQGNLGATVLDCMAEDLPATSILSSELPGAGDGFWYLVRPAACGGDGPWDSGGPGQTMSREAGLVGACPECVHSRCEVGPLATPFSASCDPCVATVCAADSFCCDTDWDSVCVQEVRTLCGSLACGEAAGSCAHTVCLEGPALASGCDDPPVNPSCVAAICAADSFCCTTDWDFICVGEVETICGANCN